MIRKIFVNELFKCNVRFCSNRMKMSIRLRVLGQEQYYVIQLMRLFFFSPQRVYSASWGDFYAYLMILLENAPAFGGTRHSLVVVFASIHLSTPILCFTPRWLCLRREVRGTGRELINLTRMQMQIGVAAKSWYIPIRCQSDPLLVALVTWKNKLLLIPILVFLRRRRHSSTAAGFSALLFLLYCHINFCISSTILATSSWFGSAWHRRQMASSSGITSCLRPQLRDNFYVHGVFAEWTSSS